MGTAKEIILRPISATEANAVVRRVHYSGKVVNNSQVHIGVYWQGKLEGAMQFGPSLDKRKLQGLVSGTGWNEFIELNRMAFGEALPRNSESRALGVALRMLRKHAPQLKWVVSFADGAQCGDGTIYRAAGFVLTQVRRNATLYELPDGYRFAGPSVTGLGNNGGERVRQEIKARTGVLVGDDGAASLRGVVQAGARKIPGYQLRYVAFLDPAWAERLTVPALPYSEIDRVGAGMYRGVARVGSADSGTPATSRRGSCDATPTLQSAEAVA